MASRTSAANRAAARRVAVLTTFQIQLRVELRDIKPLVWRRLIVPETVTLAKLHAILQIVMGWTNSHLHEYEIARQKYGIPDDEWADEPVSDERRVRLKPLVESGMRRFTYVYDFGDYWEHLIQVEDLVLPKPTGPRVLCVAGENACPPEDVGGSHGYAEFLDVLKDPTHEEHADLVTWSGGSFDPKRFDLDLVNELLATIKT